MKYCLRLEYKYNNSRTDSARDLWNNDHVTEIGLDFDYWLGAFYSAIYFLCHLVHFSTSAAFSFVVCVCT